MAASPLNWRFGQVFGDKAPVDEVTDVDIVSAIEFDHTGDFLAAGDRGGRVVIFQREEGPDGKGTNYKFYHEFQSHEPEFDYLKSLEIEEKINKIKWFKPQQNGMFLLTTNDKTIKLWKVHDKVVPTLDTSHPSDGQSLYVPRVTSRETVTSATPRKIFANAHAYHVNSISLNSDGETYISSDDLRINLWNFEVSDQSFNIVDIKPENMEELTEVITTAEFHTHQCNVFMYSSSKGTIKLCDMREAALCDESAKVFEEPEDPSSKSFFSEIISSISDIKFSRDGRYILSRDYLTLKVWDINMESKPVKSIKIHDYLRSKLCDLYENDCIFDKFECNMSGDGKHVVTGSYHNHFQVYGVESGTTTLLEASKATPKSSTADINPDTIDFNKKCLHVAWHPSRDIVAVGASNNLYLYNAE